MPSSTIKAVMLCGGRGTRLVEIINLGCGEEISIRVLVKKIIDMMGSPIEPKFGALPYRKLEIWRMVCDNSKAKRLLGWEPTNSLEEGLFRTIKWYEGKYRSS